MTDRDYCAELQRRDRGATSVILTGDVAAVLADVPENTYHGALCDPPYDVVYSRN